ncbi:Appr-1-p processing protein [Butyricicoccus sp. 1XD8-22]|nr:Appr-1-p processing protein [Butyricicoccus sp. 1XD8-22]
MIDYISDDIVRVQAELIVNAANAQGYMGGWIGKYLHLKGVAESIHYVDPSIEKQTKHICKTQDLNPGDIFHTNAGILPFSKGIIHAITMNKPGQRSSIDVIEKCLQNIAIYCQENKINTVAIPLLGCGTGRLPKDDVYSLYEKYLSPQEIVYLVVNKQ